MNPKLVTASQLAGRHGIKVKTILKWARVGILPVVVLSSRCLRFDPVACEPILTGSKHFRNEGRPRRKSTRVKTFNATVRAYNDPNRPRLKWVLNCYHPTKGRRRVFFNSKEAAQSEATARRIEYANFGLKATELTSAQRIETIAALESLRPYQATITEVVNEFIARRQGSMAMFGEVSQHYLESRQKLGRSPVYLSTLRGVLARVVKTFGNRRMSEISAAEVQDWIEDQQVGAQTNNHFRSMLHAVFEFALRRKVIKENVIKDVERHMVKLGKVGILTPDQMKKLLAAAEREPDVLATLVIGGFAGLRPEEIARLNWSAIDLQHGQIDCGAEMTKTAKHRYVKIEPVLAAWLAKVTNVIPASSVQGLNFRRRYDAVRKAAGYAIRGSEGIEWPHDALRHSFASYHLAKFKNAADTAIQLGHEGTTMLFQNYRARVAESAANAWWELTPTTAGEGK